MIVSYLWEKTLDIISFAAAIKVHPRATVLAGSITIRDKLGGKLRGTTPHYLTSGCPQVDYSPSGDVASFIETAAGIEVVIAEKASEPVSALTTGRRISNFAQVAFGSDSLGPTEAQYRILREVGQILDRLADRGVPVYVVAVPILTTAKMGQTNGVFMIAGIFRLDDGAPLWLHPAAIAAKILSAAYPSEQHHRQLGAAAASPGAVIAQIHKGLTTAGLTGAPLRAAMIAALTDSVGPQAAQTVDTFLAKSAPAPDAPAAAATTMKSGIAARLKSKAKA